MLVLLLSAAPALLLQPVSVRPVLHQLACSRRAPAVRLEEDPPERWQNVEKLTGELPSTAASVLDTTAKFDEIAVGAATEGSAALALGREPGTCDPYDPKSSEYCMPEEESQASLKRTIRLGVLFFAWYFLNTAYNIGNKLVLTAFPMPWTAATWELFFGFPYVFFLWTTGERRAEPSRRAARPGAGRRADAADGTPPPSGRPPDRPAPSRPPQACARRRS